jgi:hypothetical protein
MKEESLKQRVFERIELSWPINTKEIAAGLGMDPEDNNSVKKISYHIKNLEHEEKIMTKRIGQAHVAWPHEIERLRTIHEFLRMS